MLIFFSLNINAYACDFIKVPMGTFISAIEDQYDYLPDTSSDEWGSETLKYNYDTSNFCDDDLLKNSYMNIFVSLVFTFISTASALRIFSKFV